MQDKSNQTHRSVANCIGMFLLLMPVGAAGCAKYKAFPLEPLKADFHQSVIRMSDVSVCMEQLAPVACKRYFNKDLTRVGYQPIQFTVANDSTDHVVLNLSRISVPGAEPQSVAEKCHFNTAGRAAGYGVAGLFIWPLLIPAIVDGTGSAKANGQMDIDFAAKALKDDVVVPYGTANGVLYVPNDQMSPNISMRLINKGSNEVLLFRWIDGTPVAGVVENRSTGTAD